MNKVIKKLEKNPVTLVQKTFSLQMLILLSVSLMFMYVTPVYKMEVLLLMALLSTVLGCDYIVNKNKKISKKKREQVNLFFDNKDSFNEVLNNSWEKINPKYNTGNAIDTLGTPNVDFVLLCRINKILKKFNTK